MAEPFGEVYTSGLYTGVDLAIDRLVKKIRTKRAFAATLALELFDEALEAKVANKIGADDVQA
jgi:hypothetical protein